MDDDVVFVLVDMWYNIENTGDKLFRLYIIYVGLDYFEGMVYFIYEDVKNDLNEYWGILGWNKSFVFVWDGLLV